MAKVVAVSKCGRATNAALPNVDQFLRASSRPNQIIKAHGLMHGLHDTNTCYALRS